jgi:hypothetical protein
VIHADEMATVWVVRGGPRDRLVKPFLDDGEIGVVFPQFPDGRDVDRAKALKILGVGLDDEPTKHQEHDAALFLSFVRRIKPGDLALLVDPVAGGFACGVVTGDYRYRSDLDADRAQHRRPVEWRRRLPFAALPGRLDHLPDQRAPLEDVPDGRLRDLALQCSELRLGDDPFDRPHVAPPRRRTTSGTGAPRRPRTPAPKRPSQATRAERRCAVCLVTKAEDPFDDGEVCRDCA